MKHSPYFCECSTRLSNVVTFEILTSFYRFYSSLKKHMFFLLNETIWRGSFLLLVWSVFGKRILQLDRIRDKLIIGWSSLINVYTLASNFRYIFGLMRVFFFYFMINSYTLKKLRLSTRGLPNKKDLIIKFHYINQYKKVQIILKQNIHVKILL